MQLCLKIKFHTSGRYGLEHSAGACSRPTYDRVLLIDSERAKDSKCRIPPLVSVRDLIRQVT